MPGAAEGGGAGDRGVQRWEGGRVGGARWEGAEWVGGAGRELGKAEWESGRGREAGGVGDRGREGEGGRGRGINQSGYGPCCHRAYTLIERNRH